MLQQIGVSQLGDLLTQIPTEVQLDRPLDIPPALSEIELTQHVTQLANNNQSAEDAVCFLGGGSYDHFIPAVVDDISGRSEFYTAYTPYQGEASQGSLQAFYEYQTLICQLTDMEIANASLYEGGSSVAEAVLMTMRETKRLGKVIVAESVHPEYRSVLATYLANFETTIATIGAPEGFLNPDDLKAKIDDETACVVVQHPNFFGCLEEVEEIAKIAHEKGALFVVSVDPISLGLLKRPGQYEADIVVAEGQSLGNPMVYGGPYLGIMACRKEYVRKLPGRIVGQTVDRNGKRCWTLTMETREQHIRREKATSNICTNQGLFALRAAVYLAALGPQGLRETAELCLRKAHYTAGQLREQAGIPLRFDRPFFKEFTVPVSQDAPSFLSSALRQGLHAGLDLGQWYPSLKNHLSIAVTEKRTKAEIDSLVKAFSTSH